MAARYSTDGAFDYDAALAAHLKVYQPQFDAVTLTLSDENIQPNEALLKAQKGKKEINAALAQRTYYAGRYAALCCAGYSTGRLYGMWTGEWNTGWGSKYTMDANVNLQTAALNSSNMSRGPQGYVYFLLRQMPDWEENARATHGFTDAIQAPVNTDGDKAVLTETCYPYPFRYWNAGASWMLRPLYETLQSYGNIQIPLSDEFNLQALRSVLSVTEKDLTDAQVAAIERRGYLRLEEDILYPLLTKAANYWAQLLTRNITLRRTAPFIMKRERRRWARAKVTALCPAIRRKIIRIITPARQTPTAPLILLLAGIIWKCCFP